MVTGNGNHQPKSKPGTTVPAPDFLSIMNDTAVRGDWLSSGDLMLLGCVNGGYQSFIDTHGNHWRLDKDGNVLKNNSRPVSSNINQTALDLAIRRFPYQLYLMRQYITEHSKWPGPLFMDNFAAEIRREYRSIMLRERHV